MVNNITINLTKKISMSGYKVFPKYIIPSAKEVLEHSLKIVKKNKKKKFTFIHLMDAHHSESPGRIIHTLKTFRFIPKLLMNKKNFQEGFFTIYH